MTQEEAENFEKSEHFKINLEARIWDEEAKVPNMKMEPIEKYEDMMKRVLSK